MSAKESGPEKSSNTALGMVDNLIDTVIAEDPLGQSKLGSLVSNNILGLRG